MTELVWDGKYKDGKKVAPVRIALPFQTIETVNESAQDRQRSLDLFSSGQETGWRNRLIWGDKKYVLPSLLPEFAGKVNLVYIDPPFDTGADFSFTATIPDNPETEQDETTEFQKEPSILEQKAYRDTWGSGLDSYLQWFYETVVVLRDLLAEDGSIYVHLDWRIGYHAKCVMDEVFGADNFLFPIAWWYENKPQDSRKKLFPRDFDNLIAYAKSFGQHTYNPQFVPTVRPRMQNKVIKVEGKRVSARDEDGNIIYEFRDSKLCGGVWNIPLANPVAAERTGYPTQKPEALLQRIVKASSNKGHLILDCFVGSGTTAVEAERLDRRWIACDLSRFAIHTTRKRLLAIEKVKPFVVQNLGKYERQAWQAAEFASPENLRERETRYRKFILDLYRAEPITGYAWLHGIKSGHMVHVGAVDAPVTLADVKAIASEVWKTVGKGKGAPERASVDILGWEFAFELNELAKQVAAEARVDVNFKKIPREVLEKKAVEQGDIKFFELAALSVKVRQRGHGIELKLTDFMVPPDDLPEDARKAISHWSQWIDYWAVDWDYKGDTFHNQWQSYRTRKDSSLETEVAHTYEAAGKFLIVVKVIDILGNDTTKTISIEVK